jgi:hypothetical protein
MSKFIVTKSSNGEYRFKLKNGMKRRPLLMTNLILI